MAWTASSVAASVGPASGMTVSSAVVPRSLSWGGATARMPSVPWITAAASLTAAPVAWASSPETTAIRRPLKPGPNPSLVRS